MLDAQKESRINFRRLAQRIRVPAGFILAPLLVIAAHPTPGSLIAGGVIAVMGLAIRGWASGHLKKNEELTIWGPYAHTRNPLYLGTFIMSAGVVVSVASLWFGALFLGFYLFVYVPVMFAEAETVSKFFPKEYELYSRHVPLFMPRLIPYRAQSPDSERSPALPSSPGRRFDFEQYIRHREYRAAIGLMAVYGLLIAKLYLFGDQ